MRMHKRSFLSSTKENSELFIPDLLIIEETERSMYVNRDEADMRIEIGLGISEDTFPRRVPRK